MGKANFQQKGTVSKNTQPKNSPPQKQNGVQKTSNQVPKQHVSKVQAMQVQVNNYSVEWLRQGFDWVYHPEVLGIGSQVRHGTFVDIVDMKGTVLGRGIYCAETTTDTDDGEGTNIAVRRFVSTTDVGAVLSQTINEEWIHQKIEHAYKRRCIPPGTNAWRLVHAENDDMPGVIIDVWDRQYSVVLSCSSLSALLPWICTALSQLFSAQVVWGHVRLPNGKQEYLGVLYAENANYTPEIVVQELGVSYAVTPPRSKDAGLFTDMRGLREWFVRNQVWTRYSSLHTGAKVLNLFCYTAAFSVSAAKHGAREVHSVDLSPLYLSIAKENFLLNGLDVEAHSFVEMDSFQALDKYRRKEELFDVVIADPPSFSHSAAGNWSVQNDLKRLVSACLRVLRPGGLLVISTNYGKMSPRDFSKAIQEASNKEKRRLGLRYSYAPESDFPAALHFPEARYLKCWVMDA